MLLTIDVGNTNIMLGAFADGEAEQPAGSGASGVDRGTAGRDVGGRSTAGGGTAGPEPSGWPVRTWRMRTEPRMTADELALTMRGLLGEHAERITGVAALSTVPALLRELRVMLDRYWPDLPRVVVEPGVRTGVPLLVDNPKEVGADRVINTLAAHHLHHVNCVVVDFGTSTNIDAISAKGEFLGGAFAPGVEISLDALAARAAQLRKVELQPPRSVIGKNTVEALQSGILYGFTGQVDGLVQRIVAELERTYGGSTSVLATGGLAPLVVSESRTISANVPELTLLGLRLVYERNFGA
ncbi:type III pantothenate kinase [Salinifilum ghardaiensis]